MIVEFDTDRFILEVIDKNEYSFLFKDLIVVDVGCNIGTFSYWIYKLAEKIYAIDLSEENIEVLKRNIKNNKMDKIIPYCCAIGGGTSKRYVKHEGSASGGSWGFADKSDLLVETYSLGDFCKRESINLIDVLKIDVEGAEYEILNAPDFPKNNIRTIIGEWHNESSGERVKTILERLGYRAFIKGRHFLARL